MRQTWLERFDCYRRRIVPQTFPHFPELAVAELPDELQAGPLDFPLVSGRVRQVGCCGFIDLQKGKIKSHDLSRLQLNKKES